MGKMTRSLLCLTAFVPKSQVVSPFIGYVGVIWNRGRRRGLLHGYLGRDSAEPISKNIRLYEYREKVHEALRISIGRHSPLMVGVMYHSQDSLRKAAFVNNLTCLLPMSTQVQTRHIIPPPGFDGVFPCTLPPALLPRTRICILQRLDHP
jgi:hypothetical protein